MKKTLKFTIIVIAIAFVLLNVVVIFHAYKFTHFYEQEEITVKLQKDKKGWDIAKEMLFGINATKQKNIIPDTAYKVIYLSTKDGLKLEGWFDTVVNSKGTVALFHGHGSKKTAVLMEAKAFQKMGYNTFLLDFRAHGNSEGNTCTIGFYEAEDVKLVYEYLKKYGEKNIVLWGISLGAATITKAIYDFDITPNKVILEMPFGTLSEAVVGRVKMMGLPAQPISTLLTFWGGVEHGFWAFNMKPSTFSKKINCPVLLQKGKLDPRVTDAEVEAILNNITTTKRLVYYDSSGHQSLCANENKKWTNEINAFLQK